MTAALGALARLDDGLTLSPADLAALEVFDRHCQWDNARLELNLAAFDADRCVVCGKAGEGAECDSCTAGHDHAVARSADL